MEGRLAAAEAAAVVAADAAAVVAVAADAAAVVAVAAAAGICDRWGPHPAFASSAALARRRGEGPPTRRLIERPPKG